MINDKYKKKYLKYKKKYLKYKKNKIHVGGAEEDCKLISITLRVIPQWIVGTTTEEIKMIVNLDDPIYTSISKKIDDIVKAQGVYKRYDFDSYYNKINHLNPPDYHGKPMFHVENKNITVKLGEIELPENLGEEGASAAAEEEEAPAGPSDEGPLAKETKKKKKPKTTFKDYDIIEGHVLTVVLKTAFTDWPGSFDEDVEKRLKTIKEYEALENREIKHIEDLSEEDKKIICIKILGEILASEVEAAKGASDRQWCDYQSFIDNLEEKIGELKKNLENIDYKKKIDEFENIFSSIEVIPKVKEKALEACR